MAESADRRILILSTASIVCDDPFVPVPPQGAVVNGMGFGIPGTVCYFPLTKRLCLKTIHGDYGIVYRNIDSRAVRTINHNIAAHSERFVMAESRDHLEVVIARSGCEEMEPHGLYSTEVITPAPEMWPRVLASEDTKGQGHIFRPGECALEAGQERRFTSSVFRSMGSTLEAKSIRE